MTEEKILAENMIVKCDELRAQWKRKEIELLELTDGLTEMGRCLYEDEKEFYRFKRYIGGVIQLDDRVGVNYKAIFSTISTVFVINEISKDTVGKGIYVLLLISCLIMVVLVVWPLVKYILNNTRERFFYDYFLEILSEEEQKHKKSYLE